MLQILPTAIHDNKHVTHCLRKVKSKHKSLGELIKHEMYALNEQRWVHVENEQYLCVLYDFNMLNNSF